MQPHSLNPIWTIGHSTMAIDDFTQLLGKHGIAMLIDVRTSPYSRFAIQFNKLDLEAELHRRNIVYRFEGQRLGGRPSDPTCYRSGVVPEHAEREDFLQLVDYEAVKRKEWFQQAIDEVVALSAIHRVALMCSEEDPMDCHRHRLISSALIDRGIEVQHIRKSGMSFRAEQPLIQSALFLPSA